MNVAMILFSGAYGGLMILLAIELPLMMILRQPKDIKRFLIGYAITASEVTISYVINYRNTALGMLAVALMFFAYIRIRFGLKGVPLIVATSLTFLYTIICDMFGATLVMLFVSPEALDAWRANDTIAGVLITNTLPWILSPVVCLIITLVRHRKNAVNHERARKLFHYIRPVLMLFVTFTVFGISMARIAAINSREGYGEMVMVYVSCILLALLSVTYLVQDIRYLRQLNRNESLEQQKRINDALLTGMRVFRHNIANMLYGLEGVLLVGKPEDVRAYYDDIVRKCSLIHNENIIMLQNVPSPAVTALLLRMIDRAKDKGVPVYIQVQKALRWRGLSAADTCQALGVLLDNALESTLQSRAPYISVEMNNTDGALEIVVRNTFAMSPTGEPPRFDFSDKPGHEGVGLVSVRKLLEKKRDCYMNLRVSGEYVEAQLLMG